ncbi:MAG: hypothetical protein ACREFW_09300 [Rhizomicrobium sp.]
MPNFSIWVLVAGEKDAVICASDAGSSRLLRIVKKKAAPSGEETQTTFAWQLMSELVQGVRSNAYDGVIIMASRELLKEIHQLAVPDVKKRIMAEIPRPSAESYAIPVGFENYVTDLPAVGGMQ